MTGRSSENVSRRLVLGATAAVPVVLSAGTPHPVMAQVTQPSPAIGKVAAVPVTLTVNGAVRAAEVDPRTTLLDLLREQLRLTGSKKGCDHGQCGACTVVANGRRINACLSLAVMNDGDEVTTIEGLAQGDDLHPMQAAFVRHDGLQCGYCTPGQIMSAVAMLAEAEAGWPSQATEDLAARPVLTDTEIRERMSGNLCRCAAYPGILAAIRDAGGIT